MMINLKIRAVSAYCSPSKAILADNEDLTIKIFDRGQLKQRVVLLCNGKSYAANEKEIVIPRSELLNVNVLELQEHDSETGKVLRRFSTENLYVLPAKKEYEGNRLLAEREFYQETFTALLAQVNTLSERQTTLEQRQADLENGKFTMLKFGGNKQ